jgi:hypothetical protein
MTDAGDADRWAFVVYVDDGGPEGPFYRVRYSVADETDADAEQHIVTWSAEEVNTSG